MISNTVTIGIAAYNEEKNIAKLLISLLGQKQNNFVLSDIQIISDGSTDNTIDQVKSIKSKKIIYKENNIRQGKSAIINSIMKNTRTDVLVLLDADTVVKDTSFIAKLVKPLFANTADIAAGKVVEMKPKNNFEKSLYISMAIKKQVASIYRNGKNIYTCHGRSIALSKRFYKTLQFPKNIIADDAYIYLEALTKRFRYTYIPEAQIYYQLPTNLADHKKQSHRFLSTQKQLYKIFGENLTKKEYALPFFLLVHVALRYASKHPYLFFQYVMFFLVIKLQTFVKDPTISTWEVATSSK